MPAKQKEEQEPTGPVQAEDWGNPGVQIEDKIEQRLEQNTEPKPEPKPVPRSRPSTAVKIKNEPGPNGKNAADSPPEAFLELAPALNLEAQKENAFIIRPENKRAESTAEQDSGADAGGGKSDKWIEFQDPARARALSRSAEAATAAGAEEQQAPTPPRGQGKKAGAAKASDSSTGPAVSTLPRGGVVLKIDPTKAISRQDISQRFSYVLPDGWRTYQIPYQPHDVLTLRSKNKMIATISFSDQTRKGNLEKLKTLTIENAKNTVSQYELISAEITTLKNGVPCARILGQGQIDDVDARQLQYVVPLTKKFPLVVTLTVGKKMGDKYDKLVHDVVESLTTETFATKTKQVE